ncbi:odorant receptor 43a-like [Mycetomoellerius zeteki]|uniref:odorant receptor 43a-like n=1 Tax=Mycetomoellerius zeteki TaxID=64791 RepID=UPI00084E9792|nr:PREDICTED: odorant receptor 43a-like [Trachymyrmex zeteki]
MVVEFYDTSRQELLYEKLLHSESITYLHNMCYRLLKIHVLLEIEKFDEPLKFLTLYLIQPLQFNEKIQPIALSETEVPLGAKLQMIGWMIVDREGKKTANLKKVTLTTLDFEECHSFHDKKLSKSEFYSRVESEIIIVKYITNITDPGKVLPLQTYYIYNVSRSPFYEMTFIIQGFSLMTAAITYTGTDSFMGYLAFHVCGQLENFRMRILNLDKFEHYEKALSYNVQDHIRLIRFIKLIDNTFNLMLLGLLIITQGSNLSIFRLIYILTAVINTFTHMCLYCVVGEFLVIQCEEVYKAIYHYKWYNLKPKQAKNLLIIMMLVNRPLHLTAGKFFPMTMATFCNLLKTSSGYISVLLAHRN